MSYRIQEKDYVLWLIMPKELAGPRHEIKLKGQSGDVPT